MQQSEQQKVILWALDKMRDVKAEPQLRLRACSALIRLGVVEPTLPILHDLSADQTCAGKVRLLQRTGKYILLRRMANSDIKPFGYEDSEDFTPTIDNVGAAHWRAADAQRAKEHLVIVFTGRERGFGISIDLMHRTLRRLAGQVVYLHDFHDVCYLAGIDNWGGYEKTLERLKRFVREAGAKKLYVLGHSVGGFAALQYGLEMGADAILVFSPPTSVRGRLEDERMAKRIGQFNIPQDLLDIVPAYERAPRRPHVTLVYGEEHPFDKIHAQRISHFPEVNLIPVPEFAEHSATRRFMETGEFQRLLTELLAR